MGDRSARSKIADTTITAIERGYFLLDDFRHDIAANVQSAKDGTRFYAPDSLLAEWATPLLHTIALPTPTQVSILEISAIEGARLLARTAGNLEGSLPRIGVLNFASAEMPGGGFLHGASAQEESLARSSTLYPALMTPAAQQFYTTHRALVPRTGFYTHGMIFSPGVMLLRDDAGAWMAPLRVDVVTAAAVNAKVVRRAASAETSLEGEIVPESTQDLETRIATAMRARMARVLYMFEREGVNVLVLGSFGTGAFQNKVETVARIWAELLVVPGSRFANSFDRVMFAVLGQETFNVFEASFESGRVGQR